MISPRTGVRLTSRGVVPAGRAGALSEIEATAALHQTEPWAQVRTGTATIYGEEGALAFARQHGIEIPHDVRFTVLPEFVPPDAWATYGGFKGQIGGNNLIRWTDFYKQGNIPIRIRPEVLRSDEAILAVFSHEIHEIQSLRTIFSESGGAIRSGRLYELIQPPNGILHQEAVNIGDNLVRQLRVARGG